MAEKSPQQKVQDQIAVMKERMDPNSGYREVAVEYGVFSTGISLEIQEQTAEQSAQTAYTKRVANAKVEANASEADKLTLRNQKKQRQLEQQSIAKEIKPKAVDPDDVLSSLEDMGVKLNKKQTKLVEQHKQSLESEDGESESTGTDG